MYKILVELECISSKVEQDLILIEDEFEKMRLSFKRMRRIIHYQCISSSGLYLYRFCSYIPVFQHVRMRAAVCRLHFGPI